MSGTTLWTAYVPITFLYLSLFLVASLISSSLHLFFFSLTPLFVHHQKWDILFITELPLILKGDDDGDIPVI